ncbi:MAG TPA: acyl-CoA dehydrogenase [Steroidobacteraceae bacterium]|jgi:alkylation response protein AidB-like acyl-CoA dehydrogenase|nr:acyl-CoA dehydrogenase [Steroidobacteraceae bacterium]
MDFEFTDEQRQLREALERFLIKEYSFDRYRAIKASPQGWDKQVWHQLAELGVLGVNVPSEQGGLGFGPLETLAIMDVCGPSMLLEPLTSSAVIATTLLNGFVADSAVSELLRHLAAGEQIAVLSHHDADARSELQWVSASARRAGNGYVLNGHKAVALHANLADTLLISARTAGQPGDARGISLFRVPHDAAGVTLIGYPTMGGQLAAEVVLKDVQVPGTHRLGEEGKVLPAIESALDVGLAALCAESVGVMQALFKATVEYLRTRQQFGQPIGRFQALQHRVADMLIHLEQARSMSYLAAMRCISTDLPERRRALSAAKIIVGQAGRFIGQQAVQLHGGMGMTEELNVSHLFKRLTASEFLFGDTDSHLQKLAALTRST